MKRGKEKEYRDALIKLTAIREQWISATDEIKYLMPKDMFKIKGDYVSNYMMKLIDNLEKQGSKYYDSIEEWSLCYRNDKAEEYKLSKIGHWYSLINEPEENQRVLVAIGLNIYVARYKNNIFELFDGRTGKWRKPVLEINAWTYCPDLQNEV